MTPDSAVVDVRMDGDTVLLPGVAGKQILVYYAWVTTDADKDCLITFKSGATPLSGPLVLIGAPFVLPMLASKWMGSPAYSWFTCAPGEDLVVNVTKVGVIVGGFLGYSYFPPDQVPEFP